jgi:hypothetical protein
MDGVGEILGDFPTARIDWALTLNAVLSKDDIQALLRWKADLEAMERERVKRRVLDVLERHGNDSMMLVEDIKAIG